MALLILCVYSVFSVLMGCGEEAPRPRHLQVSLMLGLHVHAWVWVWMLCVSVCHLEEG